GHRIRHCDWPPFHFAELREVAKDSLRLFRIAPDGKVSALNFPLALINEENGWSLAEVDPSPC
ncbi:MAG: hypothetical protein ACR2Q4_13105, partial [Geminicoccaceae bacterium]